MEAQSRRNLASLGAGGFTVLAVLGLTMFNLQGKGLEVNLRMQASVCLGQLCVLIPIRLQEDIPQENLLAEAPKASWH